MNSLSAAITKVFKTGALLERPLPKLLVEINRNPGSGGNPGAVLLAAFHNVQWYHIHKFTSQGGAVPAAGNVTRKVLSLTAQGYSAAQIAKLLGISRRTVFIHRQKVLRTPERAGSGEPTGLYRSFECQKCGLLDVRRAGSEASCARDGLPLEELSNLQLERNGGAFYPV